MFKVEKQTYTNIHFTANTYPTRSVEFRKNKYSPMSFMFLKFV